MKYVIITPAKNEELYIEKTLQSIVNQEKLPVEWIIVDDGSTDRTKLIAEKYSSDYSWIKVVSSKKNEQRGEGAPIIRSFYAGYEEISNKNDWDFIVKLDADLSLPEDYFSAIIEEFEADHSIGMAGGYCVVLKEGVKVKEHHASYHIRGPIKSVRRKCWNDIGGFKEVLGWDGLDEMMAMYSGWKTKNINKEVIHHRPTASDYNQKEMAYKFGYSKYKNGSSFLLTLIRSVVRLKKRPYFIYSIFYIYGYLKAYLNKEEKNVSSELARFINKFHYKRIFKLDI